MAFVTTTLSNAIGTSDTTFALASTNGITTPNFTFGTGITYLFIETEVMLVTNVPVSGTVQVQRGYAGSPTSAHGASAPVLAGLPSDFGPFVPAVKAQQDPSPSGFLYGFSAPVASAATITATGALFHVTGTTSIVTINPPVGYLEGSSITIVFDGVAPWTAGGNIAALGTPTTAGSSVTFIFDQISGKWHPSRVA